MTPLQPQCCPVSGRSAGGFPPEVYYHLHSFERVELQIVVTAPDSQLLNLLSVSRLVAVLDETGDCGVICNLQEFDRGVFRGAVICVEREKQWGENTALRSSSTNICIFVFCQITLLLSFLCFNFLFSTINGPKSSAQHYT